MSDHKVDLGQYQCPVCPRRYKRREHLQRHSSSHSSDRPHRCATCNSTFQRTDVLKRHIRTCVSRAQDQSRTRGRTRCCDRCIRLKKACNLRQPCQRCIAQSVSCCYSIGASPRKENDNRMTDDFIDCLNMDSEFGGIIGDPMLTNVPLVLAEQQMGDFMATSSSTPFLPDLLDYSSLSWQDFIAMTTESETLHPPPVLNTDRAHSLRFLDKFTSNTGFVTSFDCGTRIQREHVMAMTEMAAACASQNEPLALGQGDTLSSTANGSSCLHDPLSLKTHQILLLIKEVVMVKPRNSAVTLDWSPVLGEICSQFFSPANLRKFLELYWAIWHPNVNFVHRPTFDPVHAKPSILATMALIGACVSPNVADNDNARMWFNCVEELVFIDEDFNSDLSFTSPSTISSHRHKFQALQAAYMVCLYQTWEGNDASKRRVRRNRFATLVSTARDVVIPVARHHNYCQQAKYEFDWVEFAVREEVVRLLTWIFLLDTAFTIFNNLPPRMVIKEMKIHTPVPEACFQAMSADECYEQIGLFLPAHSPYWTISLCTAFQTLCKDNLGISARDGLAALGPLSLFALASAIHSLIFQYRNSWGGVQLLSPIHNALNNWKAIWQQFTAALVPGMSPHVTVDHNNIRPESMWKRVGFCSYCPEYWLLANLMTDKLTARNATGDMVAGTANELERLDDGPLDSILNKYDQTSMRQVNDLILSLSDFRIAG
ncbi:hypothetical protein BDW59DRAFT_131602 [Aspergillus cavernicola]|uniref:C2H2-type domain-containing protein n=1 Tax=Aspergillus cavernicola TaxID=176166 RepID=A0ABR4IXM1_9EURO